MDFSFSDEQRQLKDGVERFVRDRYQFDQWKKLAAGDLGYSEDNWKQMAELGWLAVGIPEEFGGFGGPVETMVIMEGFGRGMVLEPYLSTVVIGGALIGRGGSAAQKEAILPKIAEGGAKLSLAFAEHQSRYNLADVATTAKADGGGFTLSGRKCVVLDAPSADQLIVSARTAGGPRDGNGVSLFLVDAKAPGVQMRAYRTLDRRRGADIEFSNVKLGADALVGERDGGLAVLEYASENAIGALAAESVGAMQVLHDTTNEYLKTRKQFGVPIGAFQVLQHRMVDIHIALEQARSMAYMIAMKLEAESGVERARAASATKTQVGQSGKFVGQQSVQLHGGMGMTDELVVGHYKKRLMMNDVLFGNADHHRRRFGELDRHAA